MSSEDVKDNRGKSNMSEGQEERRQRKEAGWKKRWKGAMRTKERKRL